MDRDTLTAVGVGTGGVVLTTTAGWVTYEEVKRIKKNEKALAGRKLPRRGHFKNGAPITELAQGMSVFWSAIIAAP